MALDFGDNDPAPVRAALTVSALNRAVAGLLARSFPLVRVRGEIANLSRAASGHWYFVLKDADAQVRCVMFRSRNQLLDWMPRDGDDIELAAVVTLYEARGEFQLSVETMRHAGQGRLAEEFMRLKARLAAEGLFASEIKRALPALPRRVGVVTSLQAAALRDVLTCLARRAPYVDVVVYPVAVQGAAAAPRIVAMLGKVAARAEVDVVLLVRGGGSLEDLWAFNDEAVARAIRACRLPVVVGVGHDSDVTIADFAADVRAPTPTAAAELVAPSRGQLLTDVAGRFAPLRRCMTHHLHRTAQRLDYAQRTLAAPTLPLAALQARAAALVARLQAHGRRSGASRASALSRLREALLGRRPRVAWPAPASPLARLARLARELRLAEAARLASAVARLHALDPQAVLQRGYAIALKADGSVATDVDRLSIGEKLDLRLARGSAAVQVQGLLPADTSDKPKPAGRQR